MSNPFTEARTRVELALHALAIARQLAQEGINTAAKIPADASDKDREEAAASYLIEKVQGNVETYDQVLPVIGQYMDLPVTDVCESAAVRVVVRAFVKQVYSAQKLRALKAQ